MLHATDLPANAINREEDPFDAVDGNPEKIDAMSIEQGSVDQSSPGESSPGESSPGESSPGETVPSQSSDGQSSSEQSSSEQSTANRPCETLGDAWIQSHYEQLFRSAWLMTGDAEEAADMVQETLIVALQRKNRFDQQCQLSTWVHGIMMRVARNRRRMLHRLQQRLRRYARMLRDTRTPDDTAADGCSEMQHREWQQSIWARVANLPVAQCSVVTMRFGQQMSLQEIAVALDCPLGTVKSRLHNALKTLRADVEWNSQIPSSNPSSLAASQLPGEFENDH